LEKEVYKHVLRDLASSNKLEEMKEHWEKLGRYLHVDADMCCFYSELLLELGSHNEAAELIKTVLKREWDSNAIRIYGQIVERSSFTRTSLTSLAKSETHFAFSA